MNHTTKSERDAIYKIAADLSEQGMTQSEIVVRLREEGFSLERARNVAAHGVLIARARRRFVPIEDYR